MKNVEFILTPESDKECNKCNNIGTLDGKECEACDGTGIYKGDNHYIMVAIDPKGNKIAFDVDSGGK